METLIFYNFILFGSTVLVWLGEKRANKNIRFVLYLLSFLIVVLPAMLRFEIGRDYFTYKEIFEAISSGQAVSGIELGFEILIKITSYLGMGYEGFVAVVSFLTWLFVFMSFPRKNKATYLLLVMVVFYLSSFNLIRNMLSIAVALFVFRFFILYEVKIFKAIIGIIVASLFHKSTLIFIFVIALCRMSIVQKCIKSKWAVFIFISVVMFFSIYIVNYIFSSSFLKMLGFGHYASLEKYVKAPEFGSGLGVIAKVIIALAPIIMIKESRLIKNNVNFIFILCLLYSISVILAVNSSIFDRAYFMFAIALPIAYSYLNKNIKLNMIFFTLAFLLMFFDFNRSTYLGSTDYRVTCNSARINPYVSVLNKHRSERVPELTWDVETCEAYFHK